MATTIVTSVPVTTETASLSFSFWIGGANVNTSNLVEARRLLSKANTFNVFCEDAQELNNLVPKMVKFGFVLHKALAATTQKSDNATAKFYIGFKCKPITSAAF